MNITKICNCCGLPGARWPTNQLQCIVCTHHCFTLPVINGQWERYWQWNTLHKCCKNKIICLKLLDVFASFGMGGCVQTSFKLDLLFALECVQMLSETLCCYEITPQVYLMRLWRIVEVNFVVLSFECTCEFSAVHCKTCLGAKLDTNAAAWGLAIIAAASQLLTSWPG